jgi:hypothetical protein
MAGNTVLSYAILKTNWEVKHHDYLENFVPIVAECIRLLPADVISIQELAQSMQDRFGLKIPQKTLEVLLKRLSSGGYLKAQNYVYYKNEAKLNTLNFERVQKECIRSYEQVVDALCDFANAQYDISWAKKQSEDALLLYLQKYQFRAISTDIDLEGAEQSKSGLNGSKFDIYVVGDFIRNLIKDESSLLDFFDTILKGHMLSEAIFLYAPGQQERRFSNTTIYIDSPLLIFALGYAGEPRKAPIVELLQLAKEVGAKLFCFRHSLEEMRGILHRSADHVAKKYLRDTCGPSTEYFIESGKSEVEILLLIEQLEIDLQQLEIRVVDKPTYANHDYGVDESSFEELLKSEVKYSNQRAIERDIDSIAAIYRIRRGESFHYVEDCRAVFITANSGLARVTKTFFNKFNESTNYSVPLCYTDYVFTTLLWLKRPDQAPNISKKRLIAACYAAIQPDTNLWNQYIQEISQLESDNKITSNQYYLLRHTTYAKAELMRLTKGEDEAFAQGTVAEILRCVENQLKANEIAKLESATQEQEKLQKQLNQVVEKTEQMIINHSEQLCRRKEQTILRAKQIAHTTSTILTIASVVIVGYWLYITSPLGPTVDEIEWEAGKILLNTLQLIFIVVNIANFVFGFTLIPQIKKFEEKLALWIYNFIYVE